jgi:hypothetical protein
MYEPMGKSNLKEVIVFLFDTGKFDVMIKIMTSQFQKGEMNG